MGTLTIRNVPDETVKALKIAAAEHDRSMEAEVRALIERTYHPAARVRVVDVQARVRKMYGGKLPANAVDDFLAHRRQAWDD